VRIVDSAATTAGALTRLLQDRNLIRVVGGGATRFLVTDGEERFARVGPVFFGRGIDPADIERVDL
jgi:glutamate racemase